MRTPYPVFYRQLTAWFRAKPARMRGLNVCNEGLKWAVFGSYGLLCVLLWCFRREDLPISLAVPAATFVLLSFVRAKINRPRPYEAYELDPLIHKTTKGHSMPSRHIFSAAVIAMAWLHYHIAMGMVMLGLALLDALIRVIGGVHYPTDVAAGYLGGVLAGLFIFLISSFL
jgi:membrane-associated phospholipid phosphatase